mmetsp:Transcript_22929/g.28463  ORF Transcript_22929/g.28463 Transcript_22929/m.28463 type:complete len:129 (+) Transcript_22929:1203-1589(+)|eukprot:CAMPEP_0170452116 /NCGR_PEP_ID=MMETSP0123-20130129/1128_1 /TAXON_ID=182087 /ORGANISM="Favella ehrenbergii, Strain Fehren 1" /LENGTH=128 /DNA_ID=CAMNT_0010714027 /DNA_START=1200 /DNA_END=1586 /DNA_ORIENTATION=+
MVAQHSKSIKGPKTRALGQYNYHEQRYCLQCDEEVAQRMCLVCENNLFCTNCYVETHIIGTKKRHMYFEITYDKSKREGPSTWSQPALKIEDVPMREDSFILASEYESELSSESFERMPPQASSRYHV